MPLRIFVFIILAGSFGALLLGGCTTPGKSGKTSSTTNTTATVQKRGEEIDYSPEAVERRTEAHARYATGVLLDWQEEPEQAADEFYKAALADPNNVDLVLEVSQRLMQLKQYEKAAEVLNKATSASKVSGLVYAQLGRVYALMGKKEMAIDADKIAIKRNPGNLMGYRNLAQMYVQNRQVEEGLKVLDQASKQINVDETFLIELAELYTGFLRLGTNEAVRKNAIDTVDRATAAEPKNPLLLQRIADVYAITGQTDKATDYYLKVLEKIPSMPGLREKLVEMYLKKEDRKHAAEQLETIIRNNPTNPQYYYLLGSIAYEEKDLKKATEYFSKTILLNPDFEQVYYDLAGAQINMNKAKEALATLQKARDKFKETFVQEFFEALAYTHLKDFTNAINHFTAAEVIARATETNKLNHIFYYQLGAAYERSHKMEEAEKYLRKSLKMSPDFTEALNYLGYMWAERGERLEEAREMIEKAVKLEPKNAAYLDSLAWVLYKSGKPRDALEPMLKAVQLNEEPDATLFDHLGDIYSALKEQDKARENWKKAVALEPNKEIQKKLETGSAQKISPPP